MTFTLTLILKVILDIPKLLTNAKRVLDITKLLRNVDRLEKKKFTCELFDYLHVHGSGT